MHSTDSKISKTTIGFWLAGAYNVFGVLIVSKLFSNALLTSLDPVVFSWLGLISIMLWGFAYWSVARSYRAVPLLLLVFFVEKMIYTATWLMWFTRNADRLPTVFSESPMTASFYATYGVGDFIFGLFFLWVLIHILRSHGLDAGCDGAVSAEPDLGCREAWLACWAGPGAESIPIQLCQTNPGTFETFNFFNGRDLRKLGTAGVGYNRTVGPYNIAC